MPVSFRIDKAQRLVRTKAEGCVTFHEIRAHQDSLLADPDFNDTFDQLIDLSAATEISLSGDEAMNVARRRLFSRDSRRAVVASMPAVFGMMRMLQAHNEMSEEPSHVRVFYDLQSAMDWLSDSQRMFRQPPKDDLNNESQRWEHRLP